MTDDVVRRITLAPDPGLVKSLGTNHSLATALADLVDNSVDAQASRVLIRFLRLGGELPQSVAGPSATEQWPVLGEFRSWMRAHRGLTETTLDVYQ